MTDRPPLDLDAVRRRVAGRWPRVDVVDETTSTNADLLASAGARGDREVLVAEHQTSGRGRLDRVWTSPPRAALLFSTLVRPRVPVDRWGWLPLLTGVALAEAVRDVAGVPAVLKWPNDLLLGPRHRKAAGILVQSAADGVVIGIGLNVSTTADELPVAAATSLAVEQARTLDRAEVLAAVLESLDGWLTTWREADGDAVASGLAATYRRLCVTLGQRVRVSLAHGADLVGEAVDIDAAGRVVVRAEHGLQSVGAGDVEHLRPV